MQSRKSRLNQNDGGLMMLTRILGIFLIAFSGVTCAQSYPERSIRLIVSCPPGGGTDVTARTIVGKLSEGLGRQVVIDNRPGGSSMIGSVHDEAIKVLHDPIIRQRFLTEGADVVGSSPQQF